MEATLIDEEDDGTFADNPTEEEEMDAAEEVIDVIEDSLDVAEVLMEAQVSSETIDEESSSDDGVYTAELILRPSGELETVEVLPGEEDEDESGIL